jgi:hypothetical protein
MGVSFSINELPYMILILITCMAKNYEERKGMVSSR